MKILKYFLYFIIVLALAFFLAGMIKPTIYYGHEITTSKSVKEAWAVTQDDTKYNQWLAGFKSIDLISGESGEVGSKYKVVVNPGDGQSDFEMIETLVSIKEFDHVSLSFDSEMMTFEQTISHSEKDGKSTVKTESKVTGKNMIMRSMFALMDLFSGSFQAQEVKNIEALKVVIEDNMTDYYPAPVEQNTEVVVPEGEEDVE